LEQHTLRHDQSISNQGPQKPPTGNEKEATSQHILMGGQQTMRHDQSINQSKEEKEATSQHHHRGQQTLRHDQSINQSKVLKNHPLAKRKKPHLSTTTEGSKRCVTINQSINQRSSRATHGQREAASQHHHRGQQTLRHDQSINNQGPQKPPTGKEK